MHTSCGGDGGRVIAVESDHRRSSGHCSFSDNLKKFVHNQIRSNGGIVRSIRAVFMCSRDLVQASQHAEPIKRRSAFRLLVVPFLPYTCSGVDSSGLASVCLQG